MLICRFLFLHVARFNSLREGLVDRGKKIIDFKSGFWSFRK